MRGTPTRDGLRLLQSTFCGRCCYRCPHEPEREREIALVLWGVRRSYTLASRRDSNSIQFCSPMHGIVQASRTDARYGSDRH